MMGEVSNQSAEKVCRNCGAPLNAATAHCSVSCALAARIPIGKDALPASWELSVLLVSCFVLFNQFLLLLSGWVKSSRESMEAGEGFFFASLVAGSLWLVFMGVAWATHSPKRWGDYLAGIVGILILAIPLEELNFPTNFPSRLAIVNLLIAICLYRGVFYLWHASKKKEK